MPILESPVPNTPLTQGDVLKGIELFSTSDQCGTDGWRPEKRKTDFCLVISKPCSAMRDAKVIVAAMGCKKESPPGELDSFKKLHSFLKQLRDGDGTPDRFFLGAIPKEMTGRYYAELDSLYTIGVPTNPAKRSEYLATYRVRTLSPDFRKDLALRLFGTIAAQGFDDVGWYSDGDLDWLLKVGKAELAQIEAGQASQAAYCGEAKVKQEHATLRLQLQAMEVEQNLRFARSSKISGEKLD